MKKPFLLACAAFSLVIISSSVRTARADSLLTTATTGATPQSFAAVGTKMYVTNSGGNTVTVIDTANNFATSSVTVGSQPTAILALGAKLYVANYLGNSVSVIDTGNGNAVSTVTVGSGPQFLTTLGTKVYVSNHLDGTVTVIDTGNGNATSTVAVGVNPNSLLAIGTKVYVAHDGGSPNLYVIDTANANATSSIAVKSSYNLAAIGTTLYVPDYASNVNIVDTAHGNATSTVAVSANAYSITVIGSKVLTLGGGADFVSIIDTANGNAVTSLPIFTPVLIGSLGLKAYFTNNSSGGTLVMMDTANGNATALFPSVGGPQQIGFLSPYVFVANTTANKVSIYVQQYTVTYAAGANGSLTGSTSQTLPVGSNGSAVTAVPASGYHFVSWSDGSKANPRTDTSVSADATLTATFAADTVSQTTSAGSSGGAVSLDDLVKLLAPGPATDAYLASRGYKTTAAAGKPSPAAIMPALSSAAVFTSDMGIGAVGPDVTRLQQYLNAHGYAIASSGPGSAGNETDRFGALTRAALQKFQKAQGISATGFAGPLTRAAINR